MVNVPAVMSVNRARSLIDALRSNPPARRPKFLFLELISVLLAMDSTFTLNSPVMAPASALAVNPSEEEDDTPTDRALNRSSFCKEVAELFSVLSLLFSTPSSEIFPWFCTFSASSLCLGTDSSSINRSTNGCQSNPEASPVNLISDPIDLNQKEKVNE